MPAALLAEAIPAALNVAGDLFSQSNARDAFKHRYQDTVKDMRAAGLNPALAYGQGGGNPQTMNFGDWGTSAAQAASASKEAELKDAQANLLRAQTSDLVNAVKIRNGLMGRQTELADSGTERNQATSNLLRLDYERNKRTFQSDVDAQIAANLQTTLQTPEARARAKYYQQTGPASFYLNNAIDVGKTIAQLRGAQGLNKPRITNIYPRNYR